MSRNYDMNPGDEAPAGTFGTGENLCPECRAEGRKNGEPCENCGGTGIIITLVSG
ncbi:MAG: hypothetical protein ABT940_07080 [Alphaproteobacteria bacterium]